MRSTLPQFSSLSENVKHVIFDLDGTLYSSKSGIEFQIPALMVKHAARELNLSSEEARALLQKYRQEHKSSVIGLQKYHEIDPVNFYINVYADINIDSITVYDGLQKNIELLAAKLDLHLLTNSNNSHAKRILGRLGLLSYFKNIISVEYANFIRKPNPEAYLNALKVIDAPPSQVINIDDSFLNLEVANNLGLYTILVSNGISEPPLFWEMHKKIYHQAPSYVSASYHDIVLATADLNQFLTLIGKRQ